MTYFSEKEISKQETLTIERFDKLSSNKKFIGFSDRPTHSLVELMKWATEQVAFHVNNDRNNVKLYETFIHNTINMDGSFIVFAEENDVNIIAIHTDAITSWQTDFDDEHFISCGIFEIKTKDLKFYHCALFHKGNQNEDEVSFFNIVQKNQVEKYINFRNSFSEWQNKRDRETREIEVIGGEPESIKDLDLTWDDLILPQEIKSQIITSIEGFLKSKELFKKLNCPWKTGMGFWGVPGCHAAGTGIVMYDGSVKKVEDVVVGDLLMGPDSLPREVLRLVRGQEEMFEIKPKKSDTFIVNKGHILHLKRSKNKKSEPETINMSVSDFLDLTETTRKKCFKMCKTDLFEVKKQIRKNDITGKPNKNSDHREIEYIKSVGIGDYYGFTLDKDHLYLTDDFFIHHNCGKTLALRIIMAQYKELKPVKIASGIPDPNGLLEAAFDYAEEHAPAMLYFEDFQEFVKLIGSTNNFLQLMDGVKPRNGILTIVTGNDSDGLHSNLKNRPGRFDKFFNFPSPDNELAEKYLKKYFGDILSDVELKELASNSVTRKFSYAYLREIYINSVYIAIAAGRDAPNKDDIKASMAQVSNSKKTSESNFSTKKRKMQDRE